MMNKYVDVVINLFDIDNDRTINALLEYQKQGKLYGTLAPTLKGVKHPNVQDIAYEIINIVVKDERVKFEIRPLITPSGLMLTDMFRLGIDFDAHLIGVYDPNDKNSLKILSTYVANI